MNHRGPHLSFTTEKWRTQVSRLKAKGIRLRRKVKDKDSYRFHVTGNRLAKIVILATCPLKLSAGGRRGSRRPKAGMTISRDSSHSLRMTRNKIVTLNEVKGLLF